MGKGRLHQGLFSSWIWAISDAADQVKFAPLNDVGETFNCECNAIRPLARCCVINSHHRKTKRTFIVHSTPSIYTPPHA
jgi:hypothetical protein